MSTIASSTAGVRAWIKEIIPWLSLALGFAAGTIGAGTFLGDIISFPFDVFPGSISAWTATALLVLLVVGAAMDIGNDGEPNRLAVWAAIITPSLAAQVPGRFSDSLTSSGNFLLDWIGPTVAEWSGSSDAIGLTIVLLIPAVLGMRKFIPAGGGRGRGPR